MDELTDIYKDVIESHISWLKGFSKERSGKWQILLNADPEAAICEACVRDILSEYVDTIQPNEDLSQGGPDFLCKQDSDYFYVEVTCISIDSASKATELVHPTPFNPDASCYRHLTKRILDELRNKTPQCMNLDQPCILAIGTLHSQAGVLCMDEHAAEENLTGTSFVTAHIDTRTGRMIREPYEATDLRDSSFVRLGKSTTVSIEEARKTISAILLCALWHDPSRTIGLLHPNPNNKFRRELLPEIQFGKLKDCYDEGVFEVEWI